MFSPEERRRAVDLYSATSMTTTQVVRHLGHPTRQCLERWLAKDPRYAGWSDGACSRTTRVRLIRGRDHAGSRQPRRPRFHGWDAEREMAHGHHPGSRPETGRACLSPPVDCHGGRIVAYTAGWPQRRARRQDARQHCRREHIPWCVPTADAIAGGLDVWRSWTATARRGRRARRAVPRTTPPRRGSSDA